MNYQLRKQLILQTVEEKGSVEVKDLAELLQTSEITVRRDLATLSEQGLLYRTHGGAMKMSLVQTPTSFVNKSTSRIAEKDYICQKASQLIQDGDVVFLDCGSTVSRICQFIKHKRIKVITNSLPIVYELMGTEVSVNLIGGELDAERQAIHGAIALEHIARYQADKAFVGIDGISLARGLSAASEKEASIAMALAKSSRQTVLLCDASKLEKEAYLQFASFEMLDLLITDASADGALLERYKEKGLKIVN
ncbi:MAG: DeoR/GlpR family DNA-binding transcription regulator [Flectobacillus sp.]|uniref:DeoR/GlpR family DNA-binding transcription regulator n=1 Tax=Flectobacillus sp. TaxID=50419 RepID=UPI003B9B5B2A